MSLGLRGLKAKNVIKAFQRARGVLRSGKGDHVNIKMPNGRIITLRSVGEVKIGLLKDALKEAGLSEENFKDLLG